MFLLGSATVSVARWTCFVVDDASQNLKLIFMIHNVCTQCNDLPHCECMTKTKLLYSNIVFSVVLLQLKAFFFSVHVLAMNCLMLIQTWHFSVNCMNLWGKYLSWRNKKKLYRHAFYTLTRVSPTNVLCGRVTLNCECSNSVKALINK